MDQPDNQALAMSIGELKGRMLSVEGRLARADEAAVRIEAKIDLMADKIANAMGAFKTGAWIADSVRMIVASVAGAAAAVFWAMLKHTPS